MRANRLRLWLASVAYVLVHELRRVGGAGRRSRGRGGDDPDTVAETRRGRLSVRRLVIALSGVFPLRALFVQALRDIQAGTLRC